MNGSDEKPAPRAETGALRFGADWTGVFVRGDIAHHYAFSLERIAKRLADPSSRGPLDTVDAVTLEGIIKLLVSSNDAAGRDREGVQRVRPFGECDVGAPPVTERADGDAFADLGVFDIRAVALRAERLYYSSHHSRQTSLTEVRYRVAMAVLRHVLGPVRQARQNHKAACDASAGARFGTAPATYKSGDVAKTFETLLDTVDALVRYLWP